MVMTVQQPYSKGVTKLLKPIWMTTSDTEPDLKNDNQIIAIELTCPYETNTEKSREFKKRRFENLKNELITPTSNFKLILLEITSLGFTTNDVKCFKDFMLKLNLNYEHIIYKCQEVAMRTSFYIYCRRNKQWFNPELLSYT